MKILLKNAKILTLKNEKVTSGEILVDGNKIAQIAQKINVKADRVIDCGGNLLMPGFKNAHAHSAMVFLRGIAEDAKLDEWLNRCILPLEKRLSKNDVYYLSKLAYLEYLESGITTVLDMYFNASEIIKAANDFGMRASVLLTPRNCNLRKVNNLKPNGLVTPILGFHADYTTNLENLKLVSTLANKFKVPIYTHCCETLREVNARKKKNHVTPVEYLNNLKMFEHGGGIFHGVYLTKNDIKILKQHKVGVCTCPVSNLKLASGIAPIRELEKQGINISIGTDGAASNNSLDMIKEMQLVALLSKYRENDPASLKTLDVLKMATVNGAHFLNLKQCDTLSTGKLADIIMIDLHTPNMTPNHNVVNNLVYSANKANVLMTMIDGKILYYKHKFYLKEDVKNIYKNAERVIKRLTHKK